MKRRNLLVGAGVALAAVAVTRAEAAPSSPKAPAGSLVLAASACTRASQACLRHCLDMLAAGTAAMAACAKSVTDLIPVSDALAAVASGSSTHTAALAALVGQFAKECKTECDKHLAMAPCKACSEACAALIAEIGKA